MVSVGPAILRCAKFVERFDPSCVSDHLTKPRRKSMREFDIAKRVGAGLLRLLAVGSLAAALASATLISSAHAQSASSGPRTWHVLVGGQSKDRAIQAEGYYPR